MLARRLECWRARHRELFPSHPSALLGWKPGLSSPPGPPANKTVNNSPPSGWISCNKVSAYSTHWYQHITQHVHIFYCLHRKRWERSPLRKAYTNGCHVLTMSTKTILSADFPHAALNIKMCYPIFYVHLFITVNNGNLNFITFSTTERRKNNQLRISICSGFLFISKMVTLR